VPLCSGSIHDDLIGCTSIKLRIDLPGLAKKMFRNNLVSGKYMIRAVVMDMYCQFSEYWQIGRHLTNAPSQRDVINLTYKIFA